LYPKVVYNVQSVRLISFVAVVLKTNYYNVNDVRKEKKQEKNNTIQIVH